MWIRSQDKTKILKAEYVEYSTRKEQITKELKDKKGKPIYYLGRPAEEIVEEKIYHCIFIHNLNCGTYSNKEKALKVLDKIQEHIKNMYVGTGNFMGYLFQMPQDDEVEDE